MTQFWDTEIEDLYKDAEAAVRSAGRANTSLLQRKLRIGYLKAAKLMDLLQERKVIGPPNGSKPQELI